jgi:transcription elongation factor GreA
MRARKTFFITKSGLDNLRKRLDTLMRERFEAVKRMRTMDQEDRADPLVLVDEVRRLEAAETEVTHIHNILARAEPVAKTNSNKVGVGSTVTLQDNAKQATYTIVCPLEVDIETHKISEDSPLGRALLGKKLHETISVPTPNGGGRRYKIINIQ